VSDESILILANGEWGDASRLPALTARAGCVIAADGGWAKAIAAGIRVDCVVGDFDSLSTDEHAALFASGTERLAHPTEKDATDLELAIDHALSLSPTRLTVFGAVGGRIDHTLANVSLLERAIDRGVEVELIAGDETIWCVRGAFSLPVGRPGDRVSLLPLTDCALVCTAGLRYPLEDEPLHRTSARGVSNVIESTPVRIVVSSGALLVVHGPAEAKSR